MGDGVFVEDLTVEEQAYFDNRGEAETSAPAEAQESPAPAPETAPEPPVETPVAEVSAPETSEPAEPEEEKSDSVPLWALKEARERVRAAQAERKAIEEQLSREREARVRLEERFSLIERANQPPVEEAPPIPDPDVDPLGYEQSRREMLEREIVDLKRAIVDTKMETEISWINQQTSALTQQFAAKNPDYEDALNFVKERRREQLQLLHPTANAQQVEEQVALEYGNIVRESLERLPNGSVRFRRVPAETVYAMARTMGFQGRQAPPAPPAEQEAPLEQRVEQTRRRAAAATSLSSVSGSEGSGPLDAKRLAQMSEAEFGKLLKDKPELINKLMGA